MHKSSFFVFILALSSPLIARDYVTIVGSSSVYPFITVIVERFHKEEHQPAPVVEATGTGGGIRAFCAGLSDNHPDIVTTARRMTSSEKEYCLKHHIVNPIEIEIGLDASVLATYEHPFSITLPELQQALSQKIQRWSDINPSLPDEKIRIIGPPTTAGVFETFKELVLKPAHLEMRQDDAYVEVIGHEGVVVKKLDLNRKSLGLLSYTFFSQLAGPVKVLRINGVLPNDTTIISEAYPLVRKSYIYIKPTRIPLVKSLSAFLRYTLSDQVSSQNGYLVKYGFIPLSPKKHHEQKQKVIKTIEMSQAEESK